MDSHKLARRDRRLRGPLAENAQSKRETIDRYDAVMFHWTAWIGGHEPSACRDIISVCIVFASRATNWLQYTASRPRYTLPDVQD